MVVVVSVLVVAAPPTGRRGEAEGDSSSPFCRVVKGVVCVYLRHLGRRYEEKKQRDAKLLLETKLRAVISAICSIWRIYIYIYIYRLGRYKI